MKNTDLCIVIPCYNEEEVLHETSKRLKEKMTTLINDRKISDKSRVLFVDDGSKDRTWEIIEELHEGDDLFSGLKLSGLPASTVNSATELISVSSYIISISSLRYSSGSSAVLFPGRYRYRSSAPSRP